MTGGGSFLIHSVKDQNPNIMPTTKHKKAYYINKEQIPVTNKAGYSYNNKPLYEWDCDHFAEYVFDRCDLNNNCVGKTFLDDHACYKYLEYIPDNFARAYLYGVWNVVSGFIK